MSKQPEHQTPVHKRKRIIILVAIVLGILLAAAILYVTYFGVSRKDYTEAAQKANIAITTYNTAQTRLAGYRDAAVDADVTSAQLEQKKQAYFEAKTGYDNAVKTLSTLRALGNDNVRTAYDAFKAKNKQYMTSTEELAAVFPLVHDKVVNCSESAIGSMDTDNLAKLVNAYDAATKPCITAIQSLGGAKDDAAVTASKKALAYFAGMRAHISKMQAAYVAGNRATFESEYKAFLAQANQFDKSTSTSNVTSLETLPTPSKELNAYQSAIQDALK